MTGDHRSMDMNTECQPKGAFVNLVLHLVWHLELRCHSGETGVGVLNSWNLPTWWKKLRSQLIYNLLNYIFTIRQNRSLK